MWQFGLVFVETHKPRHADGLRLPFLFYLARTGGNWISDPRDFPIGNAVFLL